MCNDKGFRNLSDWELLAEIKKLKSNECQVLAEVVRYLAEVDRREVYRDYGYSSLFAFCTIGLGYSEGAAQRRIVAARCLKNIGEVYTLLRDGKVSLCSLSQVAKVITEENKGEVLELVQGLPKQEAERLAARYSAPEKVKRETIRVKRVLVENPGRKTQLRSCRSFVGVQPLPEACPDEALWTNKITPANRGRSLENCVSKIAATGNVAATDQVAVEERFSISLDVDAECMELINQAKCHGGGIKLAELLKVVLKEYVAKRAPKERVVQPKMEAAKNSRYIPSAVKDIVRMRDQQRCTFVAEDGTRCADHVRLEFDHKVPFYHGGASSADNLRLTCRAHNQLYAEKAFGREFIRAQRANSQVNAT